MYRFQHLNYTISFFFSLCGNIIKTMMYNLITVPSDLLILRYRVTCTNAELFPQFQIAQNPPFASSAEHSTIIVPTQIPFDLNLCGCLFGCSEWACCM